MNYITIVLIATAIAIFLLMSNKLSKARENKLFDFIISLISSFIGLLVALYFTNQDIKESEKYKTIQLLEAMRDDIKRIRGDSSWPYYFEDEFKITFDSALKMAKLQDPVVYDLLLTNDQIIRNINPKSFSLIITINQLISFSKKNLNNILNTNNNLNNIINTNNKPNNILRNRRSKFEFEKYHLYLGIVDSLISYEINSLEKNTFNSKHVDSISVYYMPQLMEHQKTKDELFNKRF